MVKTLRITTIIAAILAVILLFFFALSGTRKDPQAEDFLSLPGTVEQFSKTAGRKSAPSDQASPLVTQASVFAKYLNPAKPPARTQTSRGPRPTITNRPKTVSAKFDLIGTSFHPSDPNLSLALIDETGKGFRWVRKSTKIGHLVVEQIKDGTLVVRDGERTFDMAAQRKPVKSLVKKSTKGLTPRKPKPLTAEQSQKYNNLIDQLKAMQTQNGDTDNEQMNELMDEVMSELKSVRVTEDEADHLDQLGKELKQELKDPNAPEDPNTPKEPNTSTDKNSRTSARSRATIKRLKR